MFYAVIMAGGKGERFWPKSRTKTPKQLLSIVSKKTMIQETVNRISKTVPKKNIFVITNEGQRRETVKQLPALNKKNIVAEPCGRNTAACIGYAALLIKRESPDGVMTVLPADHVIKDQNKFLEIIKKSAQVAKESKALVTIGIVPTFPSTGYGYIQLGKKILTKGKINFNKVSQFKEKPKKKRAEEYFKSKKYLWNSGMFIWKATVILEEIKKYLPQLYKSLLKLEKALAKNDKKQIAALYRNLKNISIDYGVMEKAKNVLVTSGKFSWDDVGSWSAIARHLPQDKNKNTKAGTIENIDTKNCLILGEKRNIITTIGVSDLIIVQHKDALLICERSKDQEVKNIVNILKQKNNYKKYL